MTIKSILSSFSLFLCFVRNSPVAEKALTGYTVVGLLVNKAWYSFSRLSSLLYVASKRTHFLFHNLWSGLSSCAGIVSVLWFQVVDQTFGAWTTSFRTTEHKLHFGVCWTFVVALNLWFFLLLTSWNWMCMDEDLVKLASKQKPLIL